MEHQHPAPAKKPSPKRPQSKHPSSRTLRANAFLEQLSKKYPMVFDRENPIPLALGIHRSIRSEEHTSELQSLMRISYAVFCLKKKTTRKQNKVITERQNDENQH